MHLLLTKGVDLGAKLQTVSFKTEAQVLPALAQRAEENAIVLAGQSPEGIKRGIGWQVLCSWGGLQREFVAKAGQEELRKDQDLGSFGQGAACHLQCSAEVFFG